MYIYMKRPLLLSLADLQVGSPRKLFVLTIQETGAGPKYLQERRRKNHRVANSPPELPSSKKIRFCPPNLKFTVHDSPTGPVGCIRVERRIDPGYNGAHSTFRNVAWFQCFGTDGNYFRQSFDAGGRKHHHDCIKVGCVLKPTSTSNKI